MYIATSEIPLFYTQCLIEQTEHSFSLFEHALYCCENVNVKMRRIWCYNVLLYLKKVFFRCLFVSIHRVNSCHFSVFWCIVYRRRWMQKCSIGFIFSIALRTLLLSPFKIIYRSFYSLSILIHVDYSLFRNDDTFNSAVKKVLVFLASAA